MGIPEMEIPEMLAVVPEIERDENTFGGAPYQLFREGGIRCELDRLHNREPVCPYPEGSLAHHWETLGYSYTECRLQLIEARAFSAAIWRGIVDYRAGRVRP